MKLPVAAALATAAVTITLYPLFEGGGWFWASMGAVLTTALAGVAASRLGARPWVAPVAMLPALLVYLTAAFTSHEAWLRVIPTKGSLARLAELTASGFDDIQRYAAPVPANSGITLLTAAGVGLIALLVDVFAVRLRRAALAGLPLLALFTVPAAVMTDPIGWPAFMIGALGYVGLLVADGRERLTRWGKAVVVRRSRSTTSAATTPDTERLALSGKRIGVMAIVLAVVVPALLPALAPDPVFGFGVGNGLGGGGGNIGVPDAIAKLGGQLRQQANSTVLTYTTSDDKPRYLRIYSLDVFDGQKWTFSSLRGRPEDRVSEGPLPPAPGLGPGIAVGRAEARISVSEDLDQLRFLPLPYPATQVEADGDWRADRASLMVFSTKDEASGLDYRAVVGEPQPSIDQLNLAAPSPPDGRYLALPQELDPEVAALAARVTAGAASPYQQAVKLQEWFTKSGKFTYTLRAAGSGADALSRFVLRDRKGYCEQFASAMAVMARMLGIPARVAVGYTGGTKIGDVWTVRTHDTHSWPELYFEGVGWLRFEPTPAGAAGQGTAEVPRYTIPVAPTTGPSAGPSANPSGGADDTSSNARPVRPNPRQLDRDLGAAPVVVDPGLPVTAKVGIGLAAALLLALLPAVARLLVRLRRHRPARVRNAAWAELCDTLTDFGMPRRPDESPRALGLRLRERHELDPETAASLARVVTAEERLRYAPSPAADGPRPADLRRLRRGLGATVSRWRRFGALVAPMSTLLRLRAAGAGALDVMDRLEGLRLWPGRARDAAPGGTGARTAGQDGFANDTAAREDRPLVGGRR
ncbi:DUF3488 and DUF4129 domain-containing transglutaminase family protein [Microbispora sp. NPDC049125]|uniref:transglutaminase TgpA family protein n=1 Tax=Microbispora sp. NPDC049125 TaxID=3154929 RepID=UPI003465129F